MKKLLPLILILTLSCHKPASEGNSFAISSYPLNTADQWTYQVTNYPPTQTDTAIFQIVSASVFGGTITWQTSTTINNVVVDSGTIMQASSWVSYTGLSGHTTSAGSGLFDGWVLNFPIKAGSTWSTGGESFTVTSANLNVSVLSNTYTSVYQVLRTSTTPAGMVTDTLLVSPGIGILQSSGAKLISYSLH